MTQLFTENYMVRFLLENSLGAWWAARHPDSPLVKDLDYLRFDDEGKPAAGSFDGWPERVAEVTVMDPCCGSGHFLVEAFSMLWQMRVEEEGPSPVDAQDAVLRDNLFGLEIDPRCVQIAMFAVAFQAWKAAKGWRQLAVPNIACCGVSVKAPVGAWKALAPSDQRIQQTLVRLHSLFRQADTLGSLIDPRSATEIIDSLGFRSPMENVDLDEVESALEQASVSETSDPATAVLGAEIGNLRRAAQLLARSYILIATNFPYLKRGSQTEDLRRYLSRSWPQAQADLANALSARWTKATDGQACLLAQNWMTNARYQDFRKDMLHRETLIGIVRLGSGAFREISGEVVKPVLLIRQGRPPVGGNNFFALDTSEILNPDRKAESCRLDDLQMLEQQRQATNPDYRILLSTLAASELLAVSATAWQGIASSDYARFGRSFWELPEISAGWRLQQSTVSRTQPYGGREHIIFWEDGYGAMTAVCQPGAPFRGKEAWGRTGVVVAQMGDLPATLYGGECFDNNSAVVTIDDDRLLPALWAYCSSADFAVRVREIDQSLKVTNSALTKVPFDVNRWRKVADDNGPLPVPWSDDPTQWLFEGYPEKSTSALVVGIGRLVGYRWPEQAESDELDPFVDADGIVCLPPVAEEAPAADRVQELLAAAYHDAWSPTKLKQLLEQTRSKKNLADWLRDEFFKQHCALFGNRPFIWHIWDGLRDGFSALVNYHRLDHATLERLTYTYLGQDWVERQRAEVREEVPGAETRLEAALELKRRLEKILDGEEPFDIFVRWKELHEQPIGWEPDLNDGVRLNIRPFVKAGVLRSTPNVHWKKDRGKNPDGSERHNKIHLSLAEKHEARKRAGIT